MKTVSFIGHSCIINFGYYKGGRTAIMLNDDCDMEPIAIATVNIPECHLEEGEVLIKNWSENKGILDVLAKAGIIEDTGRTYPTGFCEANICKLLYKGE